MTGKFDAVDLSLVPAPEIIDPLSFETILADLKIDLETRDPAFTALFLESDPATKLLEVCAFRELIIRQRVNDAARATMLAHATGADLDNLAALVSIARQVIDPGNPAALPPVPATLESDDRLRTRAQLAMEGISTAGPEGAYIFHAVSADPRVADVDVASPVPGAVQVTILSTDGDGTPVQALLDIVNAALNDKNTRPLTDQVTVQAGTRIDYLITAELFLYTGPDSAIVLQSAIASITAFAAAQKKLGEPVTIDGLHKALRVEGVRRVNLIAPVLDIQPDGAHFTNATAITVTIGVGP